MANGSIESAAGETGGRAPGSAAGAAQGTAHGTGRGTAPRRAPGTGLDTAPGLRVRARRIARDAWRMPDRLLHARRRAALLSRLGRGAPPGRILFVCHGNIIRSPFAEHLARARAPSVLDGRIDFASAGFIGPGRPSPPEALEAARLWGIDLSPHRSRLLSRDEVSRAGLVFVVEPRQRHAVRRLGCPASRVLLLGDLDPEPVATREIVDPFGRPGAVLLESYRRIVRCVDALLGALATGAGGTAETPAGPTHRAAVGSHRAWRRSSSRGARAEGVA